MQEKREILPDLEHIRIIYCTPTEFGRCLPLEIENAIDGWQAHYIGTPSKGSLKIEPHYEFNNDGDSIVVFLEYLEDGKANGKYILHKSNWFVNGYDGVSYISSQRNDTIDFYTKIIEDGTVFTANPDAKEAIRKTMEYEGNDPIGCGSERRDLNMAYLIHSNPDLIHERIKVEDLLTHDSPDGKLRIYTFTGYTGGNGAGSNYDIGILQYKTGNGEIAVLDYFTTLLYNSLTDFGETNFPYCTINSVRNVAIGGNNYYLIEALFNDSQPMSLNESDEFLKTDDTVLFAFTIKDGKLTPAHILEKDWKIEIIGSQETKELHFGFDKATNMVRVPIVEGDGHLFNGKYRELKIGYE
jgi:hypothetical protein